MIYGDGEQQTMAIMGIVADDLTGAHDIGCMFARFGFRTMVYTWGAWNLSQCLKTGCPDVAVIDTNSRYDFPSVAAEKVSDAARILFEVGCDRFYKKTCSVFRGNVGAELDALLEALGQEFAVVVAGYPKNRRTMRDGLMFVDGVLLEDSHFRRDPAHPTRVSNLVDVLREQTDRPVFHTPHSTIEKGNDVLRASLDEARGLGGYWFPDAPDQVALERIAEVTVSESVFAGSAGLAEEIARRIAPPSPVLDDPVLPPQERVGILCVAGSISPVTCRQVNHFATLGAHVVTLDASMFLKHAGASAYSGRVVEAISAALLAGRDVVVRVDDRAEAVQAAHSLGRSRGFQDLDVAARISRGIASIAALAIEWSGTRRVIVAGGDTSAAVCADLGITAMRVLNEIEPGIPGILSQSSDPMLMVLKGGSMGSSQFLEKAVQYLRAL